MATINVLVTNILQSISSCVSGLEQHEGEQMSNNLLTVAQSSLWNFLNRGVCYRETGNPHMFSIKLGVKSTSETQSIYKKSSQLELFVVNKLANWMFEYK